MTIPTDFTSTQTKKAKWMKLLLVISLALNVFGVSWYVSHGVMDSNLPIAQALKDYKKQSQQADFSEVQLVERITSQLSEEGAELVFQEYAMRKPKLDQLIYRLEKVQAVLKNEIARDVIRDDVLSQNLAETSLLMAQRLTVMTDLVAVVLPKLSMEDRRKIGTLK